MRFRIPEIFLGAFLAAALFAMGMTFQSSVSPQQAQKQAVPEKHSADKISENRDKALSLWVPVDSVGLYTLVLAAFTALLVAVSGLQGYFLLRSNKTARIAADAASRASETARAEFVASHRPKLRVRNIVVNPPRTVDGRVLDLFAPGHIISGQFFIANVGGSRADILDGHCMVFWSREGLPMRRPYEGEGDNLQAMSRTLLSGQSTTAIFRSAMPIDADVSQTVGRSIARGFRLYVMGWVSYADRNNDVWRTGFCREYMPTGGFSNPRFFPVDDPDYEHEE